jgi:hypothetical protein
MSDKFIYPCDHVREDGRCDIDHKGGYARKYRKCFWLRQRVLCPDKTEVKHRMRT